MHNKSTFNEAYSKQYFTASGAARRSYKCKFFVTEFTKIRKTKALVPTKFCNKRNETKPVWISASCPNVVANGNQTSQKYFSTTIKSIINNSYYLPLNSIQRRSYSKVSNPGSPDSCPPCGPCGPCVCKDDCLPPPCNTQPKCLQNMTGYYYYPYGTWFCGPYHVAGISCPVGSNAYCGSGACPKCSACVFPAADLGAEKKIKKYKLNSDIGEAPCQTKSAKPSGTSLTKTCNFHSPEKKNLDPKPTKKNVPPVLSSMICPNTSTYGCPHISNNNLYTSYPTTHSKSRSNSV